MTAGLEDGMRMAWGRGAMTGRPADQRPVFTIRLRPEPHVANPTYTLRRALKALLRLYGLRCVFAREDRMAGGDAS